MSTYVSIGRNIGDEPMSADLWRDFRRETENAVERFAGPLVSATTGTGYWEGASEDTAVVVGAATKTYGLVDALDVLRRKYGQEAIVVAYAQPQFITGETMGDLG